MFKINKDIFDSYEKNFTHAIAMLEKEVKSLKVMSPLSQLPSTGKFIKSTSKPKTIVINIDCFVKSSFKKESDDYKFEVIIRKPDESEFTVYIAL